MKADESMREEYDFSRGRRGKYAERVGVGSIAVVLDPDVAAEFPDAMSVNAALREIISARKRPSGTQRAPRGEPAEYGAQWPSISWLRSQGFHGFVSVAELRGRTAHIPMASGIYAVIAPDAFEVRVANTSRGGHHKGRNPSMDAAALESRLVPGSRLFYVGMATTLRSRISTLLRFGSGAPVGHWGGRYLWQLEDAERLLVAWRVTDGQAAAERELVEQHRSRLGSPPFANIA